MNSGCQAGFTLLFAAPIQMLVQQLPFAAVARMVGESPHWLLAVCERTVHIAVGLADETETLCPS